MQAYKVTCSLDPPYGTYDAGKCVPRQSPRLLQMSALVFCRIFCLLLDTLKLFLNYQFVSFALGEHKTGHRAFSHPLREDSETVKTRYAGLQVPESHR